MESPCGTVAASVPSSVNKLLGRCASKASSWLVRFTAYPSDAMLAAAIHPIAEACSPLRAATAMAPCAYCSIVT